MIFSPHRAYKDDGRRTYAPTEIYGGQTADATVEDATATSAHGRAHVPGTDDEAQTTSPANGHCATTPGATTPERAWNATSQRSWDAAPKARTANDVWATWSQTSDEAPHDGTRAQDAPGHDEAHDAHGWSPHDEAPTADAQRLQNSHDFREDEQQKRGIQKARRAEHEKAASY